MKNNKSHIVGTFPKSNRKILERGNFETPYRVVILMCIMAVNIAYFFRSFIFDFGTIPTV
jgi:hypothetical protein